MKVFEIIREQEGYSDSDFEHSPESPHASDNLKYALSDMAVQELVKIEQDPVGYYEQHGQRIDPQTAQEMASMLSSVDDKTFELIANSKAVTASVENNYDSEQDASFIGLDAMQDVMTRVRKRG